VYFGSSITIESSVVFTPVSVLNTRCSLVECNFVLLFANSHGFLLIACYVPNVAKRSIWDQCKKKYVYIEDRRLTDRPTNLSFGKISNGHISARGPQIHVMFGSMVGFSGLADRMALFPVWQNPRWRAAILYAVWFRAEKWSFVSGYSLEQIWYIIAKLYCWLLK